MWVYSFTPHNDVSVNDRPHVQVRQWSLNIITLYSAFGKSLCTYERYFSIERTIVSKNWIKQLHILPVLHFNRCLTTEYSETTAQFNGNFDTDNRIYVQ
jgi:hypothetical protein